MLFLKHLKEPLVSLELHVGYGLVLEASLVLILGLTLSLNELLLGYLYLFLSKLFLPGESLFEGIFDLLDVLELGQTGDLLEADPLLKHRLLVLLKLPLPLQLRRGCRLLLLPDPLLIGEDLLSLDPELFEHLVLPREFLLLADDLLADADLAGGHLFGVPREQGVMVDHGHREGLLDVPGEDARRVRLVQLEGQGGQLGEGEARRGALEGCKVVQGGDLGEEGRARADKEGGQVED